MIKIGIVSDTHMVFGEDLPKSFLEAFKKMDIILHSGDIISLSIIETLKKLGPEVKAVWGNMDSPEVKRALQEKEIIQVGKHYIGLTHGSGSPANIIDTVREKFSEDKVDCIIFGHSHNPYSASHNGILYFNPGSLTDRFFAPYNSYGVLEVGTTLKGKIVKFKG